MLFLLAGAVLLLCAGLLALNARESEASAQAVTKACTDMALGKAERDHAFITSDPRLAWYPKQPADISHCTYQRRWDMNGLAFAGIALAGGLGILAFGFARQQAPA
jgi:hypothetical protein